MRELLLKIGYLFGLLFPYNRYVGILHLLQWIYTGYRSRNFLYFGKTSKLGFSQHICGEEYIVVRENVIIGKANSLTAFPVNNKQKIIIEIGDNCVLGQDCHITAAEGVFIGKGVRTGKSVLISDNAHGDSRIMEQMLMPPNERPLTTKGPIYIGDNVWIGEKAAILSGVKVGEGAIVGANSVVTHDVPPYTVVAGCPAKIIYKGK